MFTDQIFAYLLKERSFYKDFFTISHVKAGFYNCCPRNYYSFSAKKSFYIHVCTRIAEFVVYTPLHTLRSYETCVIELSGDLGYDMLKGFANWGTMAEMIVKVLIVLNYLE